MFMKRVNKFVKKASLLSVLLLTLALTWFMPEQVLAATKTGSITIQLKNLKTQMNHVEFKVYPVGKWNGTQGSWELDSSLQSSEIVLDSLNGASEWKEAAQKLSENSGLSSLACKSGETDINGQLKFSDLEWGMYLVVQTDEPDYGMIDPFMVPIPYVINGVQECNRTVSPKAIYEIKQEDVSLSEENCVYDGTQKKPEVTLKLAGGELEKDKDYTVSYSNNIAVGTGTVTITGMGNYTGTADKSFTIRAKIGKTFSYGKNKYKVTGTSTVAFSGISNNKVKRVTIPATVKYGGKTFKVTAISKNALKNKKKVTSVTIGKNVKSIGASAFYGCKKLKNIDIKSAGLKTIGKKAFKGISAKATINVPKGKLSAYEKLLKGKGQKGTVTIKNKKAKS